MPHSPLLPHVNSNSSLMTQWLRPSPGPWRGRCRGIIDPNHGLGAGLHVGDLVAGGSVPGLLHVDNQVGEAAHVLSIQDVPEIRQPVYNHLLMLNQPCAWAAFQCGICGIIVRVDSLKWYYTQLRQHRRNGDGDGIWTALCTIRSKNDNIMSFQFDI